jgi:hypothetical protein
MTTITGAALRRNRYIWADAAERRALFTREPDSQQISPASSTRAGTASIDAWIDWPASSRPYYSVMGPVVSVLDSGKGAR